MTDGSDPAQAGLVAEFRRLADLLERYGAGGAAAAAPEPPASSQELPLGWLMQAFELTRFEADILLLCAGMELDADCAGLVTRLQPGGVPTFSFALAALPDAHWSALLPDAPLRRWGLIDLAAGATLVGSGLKISERILHFLIGLDQTDPGLPVGTGMIGTTIELAQRQARQAEDLARHWHDATAAGRVPPSVLLWGGDRAARQAIVAAAAGCLGLAVLAVPGDELARDPDELQRQVCLIEREALLQSAWILLSGDGQPAGEAGGEGQSGNPLGKARQRFTLPLILSSDTPPSEADGLLAIGIDRALPSERAELWQQLLPDGLIDPAGIARLAYQFDLPIADMAAALAKAMAAPASSAAASAFDRLWQACRDQARRLMPASVERIEPRAGWDQLVLPPREAALLRSLAAQLHNRALVYGTWQMTGAGASGPGIAALFAGASGTGKTLAAEVLARELGLDLYRIDLSLVVSKYIGETEKNLRRLFDAAEAGGAVLLFDEADALFGKRSEVKDSHDRHANIEVGYLLQRIESYSGLAILTSNLKDNLDSAFHRRLRLIIDFPFPDAAEREAIWRRIFPDRVPRDGLDYARLAQLNVSGGNIRTIALNAAFLAAEARRALTMADIAAAARQEYAKLQRSLSEAELRGWG